MQYCAPVDLTISALTSPVKAPAGLSAQFSAASAIGESLRSCAIVAR